MISPAVKPSLKKIRGFVFVEILLVLSLLGILTAMGIAVYRGQLLKGYDARRKGDLDRISKAVSEYEIDFNCYPDSIPACDITPHALSDYVNKIPCDPETQSDYLYEAEGGSCPGWYRIYAILKNTKDPIISELGCTYGCGAGFWYNYYASSPNAPDPQQGDASTTPTPQVTLIATPTPIATPSPTPGPTATPTPTVIPTPTSAPSTLEVRVASGSDDAEERISNGSVNLGSTDLELIRDGSNDQEVGMRFRNVTIPQGATITNVYIEFETDETLSEATSVTFYAQDIDDAPTFSISTNNITSRTKTTASVAWNNIPAWNTISEKHQTPNLSSIVQEVIDRPGWSSGNDLVVIVTGSGRRVAESYNGESANAPLLHIEYQ